MRTPCLIPEDISDNYVRLGKMFHVNHNIFKNLSNVMVNADDIINKVSKARKLLPGVELLYVLAPRYG